MNPKGEPFKTKDVAAAAQKDHCFGELVEVADGWVVRKPTSMDGTKAMEQQPAGTCGTGLGDMLRGLLLAPNTGAPKGSGTDGDATTTEGPKGDNVVTPEGEDTEIAPTLAIVEHVTGRVKLSVTLFETA